MILSPQHGTAVVETDHALTKGETEGILAQLQAMGIRGYILPAGVRLAHVADQGLEPGDGDDE